MKTFIFGYLAVICIVISLEQVQAETAIDVDELSASDHLSHKIDALKSSIDNHNEIMNNRFERYQNEVDRKFNKLEEIIQKLVTQQNDNQNEMKQHIESMEQHSKSITLTHVLLEFLSNKEHSKICVRSNDQTLVCTAVFYPASCAEYDANLCANGKCRIKNLLYSSESFLVPCDDATDGGGWTVIQRRINGSVDFYRGWSEYKTGFGHLDGEFWIGLDKLHALTSTLAPVELLIQLKDHNDILKYARYGKFSIGSELEMYELKEADDYEGNAGDSFSRHKGYKFTTHDKDNDVFMSENCAHRQSGAWWYGNCAWANLNGLYYKNGVVPQNNTATGICWKLFHGYNYSMKFVQMMIRPKKT